MEQPKNDFAPIENLALQSTVHNAVLESVRLGLFDALEGPPKSAAALARDLGLNEHPLTALLNMLAAAGMLEKRPEGWTNAAPTSEFLVSTSPFYQGLFLEMRNAFAEAATKDFERRLKGQFDSRSETDHSWALEDGMEGTAQHARLGALQDTADFVSAMPEFGSMRLMCDIGGNHGEYSMALLERNRELCGEIIDLPEVAETSKTRIAARGFADRLRTVGADLRSQPLATEKYDLIFASHVLYAFLDDLEGVAAGIHNALKPGGLFVAHHQDPDAPHPPAAREALEFMTRMSGYAGHHLARGTLEDAFGGAGFIDFCTAPAGGGRTGLLFCAKRKQNA